jgi:RNA polymerase sigma-70 factor (ECF subfamily)
VRRYDPERAAFATYLYGMVRNLSRERLRRSRRLLSFDTMALLGPEPTVDADPTHQIEGAQLVAEVRRALGTLPSRYRELIILCDLHGQSYGDAAVIVGSSVPAVRSRLHRGRQLLRLRLARLARDRQPREMNAMRCAV